jgi:two-component system phosphate regulon response regulator PhoB
MTDELKTILLADDEAHLRRLVRTTLEDLDYVILEAEDGAAALRLARERRPDLLILDWMMPGLSGLEVAEAARRDPRTAGRPIILLTARSQVRDLERGRAAGVFAYLTKPFSPLELLREVERALATPENRDVVESGASSAR